MNGTTHFLVGIVIAIVVWHLFSNEWAENKEWAKREAFSLRSRPVSVVSILRVLITCTAAFFSHALVDGFAIFTYHPWKDHGILFNLIWTPVILAAGGIIAIIALKKDFRYMYGIAFALAFDLWDYSTLPIIGNLVGIEDISLYFLHHFEWAFINIFLSWAPNFYLVPAAAIVEIVIIIVLILLWYLLEKNWPMSENRDIQPNNIQFIIIIVLFAGWIGVSLIL